MSRKWSVLLVIALLAVVALSAPEVLAAKPPKPTPTSSPPMTNPALVYAANVGPQGAYVLYLMSADGASKQQLTSNTLGDTKPTWNGDGSAIAFIRATSLGPVCSLYSVRPDGTGLTWLHEFCASGEPTPGSDYVHDWSPDGTRYAYTSSSGHSEPHIYVVDLSSGSITDLTPGPTDFGFNPSWSPDGGKIAYEGAPYAIWEGPRGIAVRDLATGNTTYLTPGVEAVLPAWSSDGQFIAYYSAGTLMRMRVDGSDKTSVATVRDQARPTWSSDDQFLAFHNRVTVKSKTTNDLFRVRTDGTCLTNLTMTTSVWESWPDWNPAWENDL